MSEGFQWYRFKASFDDFLDDHWPKYAPFTAGFCLVYIVARYAFIQRQSVPLWSSEPFEPSGWMYLTGLLGCFLSLLFFYFFLNTNRPRGTLFVMLWSACHGLALPFAFLDFLLIAMAIVS